MVSLFEQGIPWFYPHFAGSKSNKQSCKKESFAPGTI